MTPAGCRAADVFWLPPPRTPLPPAAGAEPSRQGHPLPQLHTHPRAPLQPPCPAASCNCAAFLGQRGAASSVKSRRGSGRTKPLPALPGIYLLWGSTASWFFFPTRRQDFSECPRAISSLPAAQGPAVSCAFQALSSFPSSLASWHRPHCTARPSPPTRTFLPLAARPADR